MTLIEGVGDEVTQFFVLVFIVLVGLIAWWSTSIVDQPLIRTVLILERRARHRIEPAPTSPANSSLDNSIDTGQIGAPSPNNENQQEIDGGAACQINKEAANLSSPLVASSSSQNLNDNQTCELPETSNSILNERSISNEYFQSSSSPVSATGDGDSFAEGDNQDDVQSFSSATNNTDSYLLRRRRLAFFQSRQVTLLDSPVTDGQVLSASSSTDTDNIDTVSSTNNEQGPTFVSPETSDDIPETGSIRIRLKYLNDDQKLVDGRLHEQLGDFKR